MKLGRLLQTFLDPASAGLPATTHRYACVEAGRLNVRPLEERCVLAAGPLANGLAAETEENSQGVVAAAQPLSVPPAVVVPGDQATVEGSPLIFSAATGRLIRIDDPDIGSNPLVVDLTAFESLGRTAPYLTLASTAGLTSITGNGTNVLRLEGTLPDINAALSYLTFYSVDNGDFNITVTASDMANGDVESASFLVQAQNAAPQIEITGVGREKEGSFVQRSIQVFDPGLLDNPQVSWVVSYGGTDIAEGVGPSMRFFAAEDGAYTMTVTAVDKDGGISTVNVDALVDNVSPVFDLTGFVRDGVAELTIVMNDPGRERFLVQVFWTHNATTPELFVIHEKTFTLSHEYTTEELELNGANLSITVYVFDNEDFERKTLHFREGAPAEVSQPRFESPPPPSPPDRVLPVRPQPTSTTPQLVSADLARAVVQGRQEEGEIQQFVLRVVGPDGTESNDYPLPGEALENLPEFLTTLGVPDGHYRIYLVTGELERLVIDAHLRAGRIIDPSDESQPTFDRPPDGERAGELASQNAAQGELKVVATANQASSPAVQGTPTTDLATEAAHPVAGHDGDSLIPLFGSTIVVAAAAVGLATLRVPAQSAREENRRSPRFTKAARWARKLRRLQ